MSAGSGGGLRVDVVTLFPAMFEAPLHASVVGRAIEEGLLRIDVHDLRAHGLGRHRTVDDTPYGGGAGMVLRPEPIYAAVEPLQAAGGYVILLDPAGAPFGDALARNLAGRGHLVLVCGRYEGFDERVRALADLELSIGDYVLTGGEVPALVVIDAVTRLVPGVIEEASHLGDSFAAGLLEGPQYTRPDVYRGMAVPAILRSGHHAEVERWRRAEAIRRTAERRPDLLSKAPLTAEERASLEPRAEVPEP